MDSNPAVVRLTEKGPGVLEPSGELGRFGETDDGGIRSHRENLRLVIDSNYSTATPFTSHCGGSGIHMPSAPTTAAVQRVHRRSSAATSPLQLFENCQHRAHLRPSARLTAMCSVLSTPPLATLTVSSAKAGDWSATESAGSTVVSETRRTQLSSFCAELSSASSGEACGT